MRSSIRPLFVNIPLRTKIIANKPAVSKTYRRQPLAKLPSEQRARLWLCEPLSKDGLIAGLEVGLTDFVFRDKNIDKLTEWAALGRFNAIAVQPDGSFEISSGSYNGHFVPCSNAQDIAEMTSQASEQYANGHLFVMDRKDGWRVIPVENLVAAKQQDGCNARFGVVVHTSQDASTMMNLLDMGVDGVVLSTSDVSEIRRFGDLKTETEKDIELKVAGAVAAATITDVRPAGSGDRVCVDCTSNMTEDEALLCGNSSQVMFFVLSEAKTSDYVQSRPFRCNAGPVHAYVLCPGGRTKYLAELEAGDEVLSIRLSSNGTTARNLVVGRTKLERRPLLLVTAEVEESGRNCSVLLQNAETVRIACLTSDDIVYGKSVVELRRGDRVAVRTDESARHLGMPINEHLLEK